MAKKQPRHTTRSTKKSKKSKKPSPIRTLPKQPGVEAIPHRTRSGKMCAFNSVWGDIPKPVTSEGKLVKPLYDFLCVDDDPNKAELLAQYPIIKKSFASVSDRLRCVRAYNSYDPLPRVVNTSTEGLIAEAVRSVWEKEKEVFVKFDLFVEKVRKHAKPTRITPAKVIKALHNMKIQVKRSKNVANAENQVSCARRLARAIDLLKYLEDHKISAESTKRMYFMDESCINQLQIEDDKYLSPRGVNVYKKHHGTIQTESLTLLLMVDDCGQIIHWEVYRNLADGATSAPRVKNFLTAAYSKIPRTQRGLLPLFLDNAPAHAKAFKDAKDEEGLLPIDKQWLPLYAPSCTPESNVAEYFFANYKHCLRDALSKHIGTMKGSEWIDFNTKLVKVWESTISANRGTFEHIQAYLQRLILAKGNLQVEALLREGYHSEQELKDSLDEIE